MLFSETVNKALGRSYGTQSIPGDQIAYFIIVYVVLTPLILLIGFLGYLLFSTVIFAAWMAVSGEDPAKAKEKLHRPRIWRSHYPFILWTKAGLPAPDLPSTRFYLNKGRKCYWVERNYETYITPFEYQVDGERVAAYVHQRGRKVKIIFGWQCCGHDPLATESMIQSRLDGLYNGTNSYPTSVDVKVVNSSFIGDSGYIQQLRNLSKRSLTALERLILAAKMNLVRSMISSDVESRRVHGFMQSETLHVYAKYGCTFAGGLSTDPNRIEKFISDLIGMFSFGAKDPNISDWDRVAKLAWDNCYKPMNDILNSPTNMALNATPLDVDELWDLDFFAGREKYDFAAEDRGEYGVLREAPPVPQYVPVYSDGLGNAVLNDPERHILGHLFSDDFIPVPVQSKRSYVLAPALGRSGKYVGFLKIGMDRKISRFPSLDGSLARGSYLFLYKALKDSGVPFYDYKVYWEWSEIDPAMPATNLERRLAGARRRQAEATKRGTVSVRAENDFDESYEARDMIDKGDRVGWGALVIAVYRDTVDELSVSLSELKRRFPTGSPSIASEVCESVWHQTAPYAWEMMLTKPEHRCQQYFASEWFRTMPFVSGPRLDDKGVMLLHSLFRSPIYLDIVNKRPNHTAIIAETGEGKSILLLEFIFQYLCYSSPLIIFEFPRSDGRSTYTDLIHYLKVCGKKVVDLDVKKQRYNFLQKLDLSHLDETDPEQKQKKIAAIQDTESQQIEILTTIVTGSNPGSDEQDIKDWIVELFYSWLDEPDVAADYEIASKAGFGNSGYERMPNLPRLVEFALPWLSERLLSDRTIYEGSKKAIDKISHRFKAVLQTPQGRCLSGPSTFDIDADCIVLSLTDVSGDDESLIYGLLGLQIIYQKSVITQSSGAIVEEAVTLLKRPAFGRRIEAMPVTARKQGMNVTFAFQFIDDVTPSLFSNIQNIYLGGTTSQTVRKVVEVTGFEPEIANLCVSRRKDVRKGETYGVLKRGNQYIPCTHAPAKFLLSLGATDPSEVDARHRYRDVYGNPDDPADLKWLVGFSEAYHDTVLAGKSMNTICEAAVCV
jgi:hypothetical protein